MSPQWRLYHSLAPQRVYHWLPTVILCWPRIADQSRAACTCIFQMYHSCRKAWVFHHFTHEVNCRIMCKDASPCRWKPDCQFWKFVRCPGGMEQRHSCPHTSISCLWPGQRLSHSHCVQSHSLDWSFQLISRESTKCESSCLKFISGCHWKCDRKQWAHFLSDRRYIPRPESVDFLWQSI